MKMTCGELEQYLHAHIPLSAAMQVAVISIDTESVVLAAPLAPNINHRETVFGGSAASLAILAAWSLLHTRLSGAGLASRLVIQRNTMDYVLPISGRFTARSYLLEAGGWNRFMSMYRRRGRARIGVVAKLVSEDQIVGHFEGEFVALAADGG